MKKILLVVMSFMLVACAVTTNSVNEEKLTVAKVQKEIKVGMSSAEVVEILGSPNMVTTDSERRETWVYDKISNNVEVRQSSFGGWLLFYGGTGSYARSSNQRTLTIIVKFDENAKVRDFAYRTSSF